MSWMFPFPISREKNKMPAMFVEEQLNKIKKLTTSKITMDLQKKFPETNKSIEQMKSKFKAGKSRRDSGIVTLS